MEKNLTTGSVFKAILYFSVPYIVSYFMQTLYGMADLFIIGQFNGVESITAVSIGSQVMHMFTVIIAGLAMGSVVVTGRAAGARETKQVNKAAGNTVSLFMVLSVIFTIILLIMLKPVLYIMSVPAEAYAETMAYLKICFAGIPFITAYNIISAIFRSMGDSKSPMYFIAIACVFNIILDYIFIGILEAGASGAAFGTVLSQTISVAVSLIAIKKRKLVPGICKTDFMPCKMVLYNILKVGVPVAVQDGFIQVAFIIITVFANHRGLNDAAAVGIVEKIIGILFLVPSSMLSAVSALSAQNIGAKKYKRADQTLKYAVIIAVLFGIVFTTFMQFAAENAIMLFSGNQEVITLGGQYMRSYVWDCIFAGVHFCFSGYFCAYGLSFVSFIHNIISIIFARIPIAYIASKYCASSQFPMGIAAPVGSFLSVLVCTGAFIWIKKHPGKPGL